MTKIFFRSIAMLLAVLAICRPVCAEGLPPDTNNIRIGITPVILDDRQDLLRDWQAYLSKRLNRRVQFIQRKSYQDITDLLLAGNLDIAWVCGYPYVQYKEQLKLVAVPEYHGKPLYQSFLIVGVNNTKVSTITDLEQRVFAYSDPDSNSGYLVPQFQLLSQGIDPSVFFRRSFFTWSHRDVVEAVGNGVADAGAVDGYIWETLAKTSPQLTGRTRVAWKSPEYGFPPVVALRRLPDDTFGELQAAFVSMRDSREGKEILERLNIDGFSVQDATLFDSIARQMHYVRDVPRRDNARP